jgi:hypothetical protein
MSACISSVFARVSSVFLMFCVGSNLATGLITRPGVLPIVYMIRNFIINSEEE